MPSRKKRLDPSTDRGSAAAAEHAVSCTRNGGRPVPTALPERLVLYDGVCGLCSRTVRWLLAHDPERVLRYAPLQGAVAETLRHTWPERFPSSLETLVFVDSSGDEIAILRRSGAVWAILRAIGGLPRVLRWLPWIPSLIADPLYRVVSALRYRVFGRFDQCQIPSPDERDLFLD